MSWSDKTAAGLAAATLTALLAITAGAAILIAPVWQFWYSPGGSGVVAAAASQPQAAGTAARVTAPININTATQEQLMQLPGVGAARAAAILDYRAAHGAFATVQELEQVDGISQRMIDEWGGLVTVSQ